MWVEHITTATAHFWQLYFCLKLQKSTEQNLVFFNDVWIGQDQINEATPGLWVSSRQISSAPATCAHGWRRFRWSRQPCWRTQRRLSWWSEGSSDVLWNGHPWRPWKGQRPCIWKSWGQYFVKVWANPGLFFVYLRPFLIPKPIAVSMSTIQIEKA